ncbi:hypothetical protein [Pseudomonas sp. NFX98]|uniref:hypothetical protein n=1 Tax=Pseudomonas sp. NFX98 TaxID=3399122 RepID=UPI0039FD7AE5
MHTFTHGDKTIAFTVLSGEVVGSEKLSETRVTTTGGPVSGNSGEEKPLRVSSVSIINHEFWIKTADGIEHDVKLRGVDIPLRTGQQISLISALKKDGNPLHVLLHNHTAAKRWELRDGKMLGTELELWPFNWKTLLIVLGLCVAGFATAGLGLLAAAAYLCYALYQGSQRKKMLASDLDAYLEKLKNEVGNGVQMPSAAQAPVAAQVESPAQAEISFSIDSFSQSQISFQVELPDQAEKPAEPENAVLDSNGVRRALSRNL